MREDEVLPEGGPLQRIDAEILIPGRGEPVPKACVIFDGARISYAGPAAAAPATPDAAAIRVPAVMPGLWDCHAHFLGIKAASLDAALQVSLPLAATRAAKDAESALAAGFTSVREAGGLGVHLARAVAEGTLNGPSIYAPGAVLSQTGGHADVHSVPVEWIHDHCRRGGPFQLCDGVPECLKAVRSQLRLGARVIKVCASGGVMSELDHPIHQQFSDEELGAIVEEAGRAERVVMAHCHGKPGIMAALRAGCRTIEHGTYLDEESAAAMRERGALLVPTRYIVERLLRSKGRVPDYVFAKIEAMAARHQEAIGIARAAGVRIALGTDIATSGADTVVPWGQNGHELPLLVAAGLTPHEAIEAATANGPLTLGPQGPRSGQLAAGFDADVIALRRNPLEDLTVLARPGEELLAVWKAGKRVHAAPDFVPAS
jgi:imidazolonepropionase-like amidohydrolase